MPLIKVHNPTAHSIVLKSADGDGIQIQPGSKPIIDTKFLFIHQDSGIKVLDKQPAGMGIKQEEPIAVAPITVVLPVAPIVDKTNSDSVSKNEVPTNKK